MDTELSTALVRLASLEQRLVASERRLRVIGSVALAGTVGAFALGLTPQARAQYGVTLAALDNRLKGVEFKTKFQSVSGTTTVFSNTNVQIVSGSGATDGQANGLGNLIVGYNELRVTGNDRTGSHNLVLGDRNNYSSFGGMVAGQFNTISAPYATVNGGQSNTASAPYACVTGGTQNIASGDYASVSGGGINVASGTYASVGGGLLNQASGMLASVQGGTANEARGERAAVLGGTFNRSVGTDSTVSGGRSTAAVGNGASVSGGALVSAPFDDSWRAGALHTP